MSIVELINAVGIGNVNVQSLDEDLIGASKRKSGTEVRFITNSMTVADVATGQGERQGLIVWLPRKKVAEIFQAEKEAKA